MKSRDATQRLKLFDAQEKARKADGLEQMMRDFEQMAVDLERQIQAEEDRTGIKDRSHFAYSTFAKAAIQRREKLMASIDGLRAQLDVAIRERDEARAEAESAPALESRDITRPRRRHERPSPLSMR
ncbi:MAG: flagellar export protein FliJ [Hyphomicrobiaceae bacterium]